MDEIIDYIKSFLVYGNEAAAKQIGYTADELDWQHYKLVIVPGKNVLTGERRDWTEPNLQEPAHAVKQGEFYDEFGDKIKFKLAQGKIMGLAKKGQGVSSGSPFFAHSSRHLDRICARSASVRGRE